MTNETINTEYAPEKLQEEMEDRWPFWIQTPPFLPQEKERLMAIQKEWEDTETVRRINQDLIMQKIHDVWNDVLIRTSSKTGTELEKVLYEPWSDRIAMLLRKESL